MARTGFLADFDAALDDADTLFREYWTKDGARWPAIAIEDLQLTRSAGMAGGPLSQATVTIHVKEKVFLSSHVARGNKLKVRDQLVRVMTIIDHGDASRTIVCGPPGVPMPPT